MGIEDFVTIRFANSDDMNHFGMKISTDSKAPISIRLHPENFSLDVFLGEREVEIRNKLKALGLSSKIIN